VSHMIHLIHFNAFPHSDPNVTEWKISLSDSESSNSFHDQFMVEPAIVRGDVHNLFFRNSACTGHRAWHDLALEDLDPVTFSKTVFLINKAITAAAEPRGSHSVQDYRRPNYIGCSMSNDGTVTGVLVLTETEYRDGIPPPKYRLDSTPWRTEPSLT
jgi:hypothetical protein